MSVEFRWNEIQFRAVCSFDGDPTDGGDFEVTELFITNGKVEIDAMGLFLCDAICKELEDAAFEAYLEDCRYEDSFP